MVFDKLANVVTKRYKLIIAIWVVALLFSVPAMLMLNDVVSYSSDMASGEDTSESGRASQIIAENFQSSVSNSTLIIVLQSDDMTEADAREYVIEVQQDLESADLPYFEGVSSIYSYAHPGRVPDRDRARASDVLH